MAVLTDDGEGGFELVDDEGIPYELLEDEAGNPAIQLDNGEILHLDPEAIEEGIALVDQGEIADFGTAEDYGEYEGYEDSGEAAQQAWLGFLERGLQNLDSELGRRLTDAEVQTVFKAAEASNIPNPSVSELYDKAYPGRRDSQDANAKRNLVTEIAQDHQDAAAAEGDVTPGWPEPGESESDDSADQGE